MTTKKWEAHENVRIVLPEEGDARREEGSVLIKDPHVPAAIHPAVTSARLLFQPWEGWP